MGGGLPSGDIWRRCRIDDKVRVNQQIRLSPVRLIGAEGEQVGVVPIEEARRIAEESGLDLVEVAPDARPIVVRIMDYGKHRFEAAKKVRDARKNETRIMVKQLKLRPAIGEHDLFRLADRQIDGSKEGILEAGGLARNLRDERKTCGRST